MLDQNLSIIFWTYWTWKTYYAVRNAYQAYLEGAIVISNMFLAFPHIRFFENEDLVPILKELDIYHKEVITPYDAPDSFLIAHQISKSIDEPRNFYILIDEWLVFFDSREFATNLKDKQIKNLFATPRHYNLQITVIVQRIWRLDKALRDLAQEMIEFTPFLFGWFRRATSYDTERMIDWDTLLQDIPILETKTFYHAFHRWKDNSKFFGWLYFTKEVLGPNAIRHTSQIRSLKQYFISENTLRDWRETMLEKANKMLTSPVKKILSKEYHLL